MKKIEDLFRAQAASPTETAGLFNGAKGRPANVTGVAAYAAETTETRARLLKEILPNLNKIHVFFDANNAFARENFTMVELAGKKLGVQVLARGVKSTDELKAGMSGLAGEPDARRRADAQFHIQVTVAAQSARLYQEEVHLQAEFGTLLWIAFGDDASHAAMVRSCTDVVDAIEARDAHAARATAEQRVADATARLIDYRLDQEL